MMVVRNNQDIFSSLDHRYQYFNRYLVLLDRVGINDSIFRDFDDQMKGEI